MIQSDALDSRAGATQELLDNVSSSSAVSQSVSQSHMIDNLSETNFFSPANFFWKLPIGQFHPSTLATYTHRYFEKEERLLWYTSILHLSKINRWRF